MIIMNPLSAFFRDRPNQGSRNYYFESPVYEPSYHKMFRQFIQAVQGEEKPVPVEEGMSAVKLALAAIRSAEMGQPVELENFKDKKFFALIEKG